MTEVGRRAVIIGGMAVAVVPGLGGTPDRPPGYIPPDQPGVAAGGTAFFNQLRAGNTIVNKHGVFVYNPSPAAGNLVASLTPAAGTDPYDNAYLLGVTSYFFSGGLSLWLASQSALGGVLFYTAATEAGPWTEQAGASSNGSGGFSFITGGGATGGSIPQSSAGITTVAQVVAALRNAGVFS